MHHSVRVRIKGFRAPAVALHDGFLCLGGDCLAERGVPDDDISVRPFEDRALLRVHVENLGNVRRGDRNKLVWRQPPRIHALGPEHRETLLQPPGSIGDEREALEAEALLLRAEGGVIGRDHLQRPCGKACPQSILMLLGTERRRHHTARSIVPDKSVGAKSTGSEQAQHGETRPPHSPSLGCSDGRTSPC